VIFLTKTNLVSDADRAAGRGRLAAAAPGVPVAEVRYQLSFAESPGGTEIPADRIRGQRLLAVSGLAKPAAFEESLRRLGADVLARRFEDHHFFTNGEVSAAEDEARRDGRRIVLTEKDRLRWPDSSPALVAKLAWVPEGDAKDSEWARKINSAIS
jgi:tetraacyldisaccharide 4'-kinase